MSDVQVAEARTREILEAVKTAFVEKSFDGASMQDLARAAGMSAGNFYRYFPSKSAIIESIVEDEIDQVRREFADVLAAERPLEALRALAWKQIEDPDACGGQLWTEIESAAARRPEIGRILGRMEVEVTRGLIEVFARIAGVDEATAAKRYTAHATLCVILVRSMSMRPPGSAEAGTADRELAALVGRTIERVVGEIAAPAGAGERRGDG